MLQGMMTVNAEPRWKQRVAIRVIIQNAYPVRTEQRALQRLGIIENEEHSKGGTADALLSQEPSSNVSEETPPSLP